MRGPLRGAVHGAIGGQCGERVTEGEQEIRAYFNRAASDEEGFPPTIDPRILHVKAVIDSLCEAGAMVYGARVADVGCGKGRFARIVQKEFPGAAVVALALAESMLRSVPPGVHRVVASMTALPFGKI